IMDPLFVAASAVEYVNRQRKAHESIEPTQKPKKSQQDIELETLKEWALKNGTDERNKMAAQRKKWNQNRAARIRAEREATSAQVSPKETMTDRVVLPKEVVDRVTKVKAKVLQELKNQVDRAGSHVVQSVPVIPIELSQPVKPEATEQIPSDPKSTEQIPPDPKLEDEEVDEGIGMSSDDESQDPLKQGAADRDSKGKVVHNDTGLPLVTIYLCTHHPD
ncbi:MAG: hypothetical protein GY737_08245, partial [Desulfobacteraceae bacterium]|nr:hypothetical protein [Desulfobacteraceae bacterium]